MPEATVGPPEPVPQLLLASLPALVAVFFATVGAGVGALPDSRKTALLESLTGPAQRALAYYVAHSSAVESRWRVLRVMGLAASSLLFARLSDTNVALITGLGLLATFIIPAEVACAAVRRRPERAAPLLLRLARPVDWIASPLATPLTWLGRFASRRVDESIPPDSSMMETELEILVNQGERDGSLAHDESEMLRNVLDFGDLRAGDLMVPRTQVTAIEATTKLKAIMELLKADGYSRYPVYSGVIDNIVGILHIKDVLTRGVLEDVDALEVAELMRTPVVFVPQSQSASSVLKDMRVGRRDHMAVVIDEFGGMSGIVTLEDLVEEIVGDIQDEHDDDPPGIVELGIDRWLVDASIPIGDVSRHLGVELPEDGDYNSLGGMLVEALGCVPKLGESYAQQGLEFVVRQADERRISQVEVTRLGAPQTA